MPRVAVALLLAVTLACAACSSDDDGNAAARRGPTTARAAATSSSTTRPGPHPSAGCARPGKVKTGISDRTIRVGGAERAYALDVPQSYDGTTPYALVLGLHALTVRYTFIPSMVGFDQGDRHRFIGVAPSGRLNGTTPFWMAAPTRHNYDVDFIARLLDELEATLCVDTTRVFSTGMSNGAQMSSLLACRLADRVAAIAPVSGEEYLEPCDGRPVPIIAFHGTADPILPYTGGGLNATRIADNNYWKGDVPDGMPKPLGIDESMRRWAQHNGCDATYHETRVTRHVVRRTWPGCDAATVLYVVEGGGHSWPGKPFPQFEDQFGPGTTEIDATELMFAFFFGPGAGGAAGSG
jgi:polyhydroxybutyrate depolymerase